MTLLELNNRKVEILSNVNAQLKALCISAAASIPVTGGDPTVSLTLADGSIASINAKLNTITHGGSSQVSIDGYLNILDVLAKHPAITQVGSSPEPAPAVPSAPSEPPITYPESPLY